MDNNDTQPQSELHEYRFTSEFDEVAFMAMLDSFKKSTIKSLTNQPVYKWDFMVDINYLTMLHNLASGVYYGDK